MDSKSLSILTAGSINKYVQETIEKFQGLFPTVQVEYKSMGSVQCVKRLQEGEDVDLLMLADYSLIQSMMVPALTDWYYIFASNKMVLASAGSPKIDLINLLQKREITFGHTHPQKDPCGYRALLLWKLAEKYMGIDGLFQGLLHHPGRVVYNQAKDMVADLATGKIDYIFEYASVAAENNFTMQEFDQRINFSQPEFKDYYGTVDLVIDPTLQLKVTGSPIAYALTIPQKAKNKEMALTFLKIFLSSDCQKYGLYPRQIPWGNYPSALLTGN